MYSFADYPGHETDSGPFKKFARVARANTPGPTRVLRTGSERGAAILLGLSLSDLRWFSRRAGLGQIQSESNGSQLIFTYDDLAKLSAISTPSGD